MVEKYSADDANKFQKSFEGKLERIGSGKVQDDVLKDKEYECVAWYDPSNERVIIHNKDRGIWKMSKEKFTLGSAIKVPNPHTYLGDYYNSEKFDFINVDKGGNLVSAVPEAVKEKIAIEASSAIKFQPRVVDREYVDGESKITFRKNGKEHTYLTRWNMKTGLVEICLEGTERWQNKKFHTENAGTIDGKAKMTIWKLFGEDIKIKGLDYKDKD